jgi:hypothetical protein
MAPASAVAAHALGRKLYYEWKREEALLLYKQAAEAGHAEAMHDIAAHYQRDQKAEAIAWHCHCAFSKQQLPLLAETNLTSGADGCRRETFVHRRVTSSPSVMNSVWVLLQTKPKPFAGTSSPLKQVI